MNNPATATVDDLIASLEARGLGWSLDHTWRMIEARVWDWPNVIGRYRPEAVGPLAEMLAGAMYQVDWTRYPVREDYREEMAHYPWAVISQQAAAKI